MEKYYSELINIPLVNISNACDMLCIDLGDKVGKNVLGDDLYEYSIHIVCPWRIVCDSTKEIKIASNDVSLWLAEHKDGDTWELFCSPKINCPAIRISQISVSNYGDMKILFSNDLFLDVFNDSCCDESWRILKRNRPDWHIVSYGKHIVVE